MATVKVETAIESRVKEGFLALLTEVAKVCNVEIWIVKPSEEVEDEHLDDVNGYGHAV